MKKISIILFFICTLTLFPKTISGEAAYQWGYNETYLQAQKRCKTEATRNAVESFATYIESDTEVKDYVMTKDVIISKSLGLVRNVKIIDEKTDWENRKIWYKITGEIDEKEAIERLNQKATGGNIESIKKSGEYYYGEGKHSNKRKADKKAIENIVTNIADDLQNRYVDILPQDEELYDFTESIINTYKTAFYNCQKKIEEKTTLRYIKKSELLKLFAPRLKKIENYLDMAQKAESETRIGDALKYYYWSLSLLRSHPDHNKITSPKWGDKLLLLALPDKINTIFSNLTAEVSSVKEKEDNKNIYLTLLYKNVDINSIGFSYFVDGDWSILNIAKNGKGLCEYSGLGAKNLNKVKLNIEYRFEIASKIDQELRKVIEEVSNVYFQSSIIHADLNKKYKEPRKSKTPVVSIKNYRQKDKSRSKNYQQIKISETKKGKCSKIVAEIIMAMEKKNYTAIKKYFTKSGYAEFMKIISYGNAKVLTDNIELKASQLNDEIIVRSLPMQFKFKTNDLVTTEKVVFTFNNENLKIDKLSFAISDIAISNIMNESEEFATMSEKMQIIQFMEYYKTAYCLKEYDYIKQIFAEDALIIVGKVLKANPNKQLGEVYDRLGKEKVKYVRMKKNQYLEHLNLVFKSKEFINIRFEDNQLRKIGKKSKVFGIQIKQNYYSSNYADEGYLFLMMDLCDIKKPEIHVRSWQPKKNADGSIIGLKDFSF